MDDKMYDFPLISDFKESNNKIETYCPNINDFCTHLDTDLYTHLKNKGIEIYDCLPRAIGERYHISIFQKFLECENKAGIVYILYKPNKTWVHISVCVHSQNNYYALTFIVDEDMEKLTDEELYNRTLSIGKLANIVRYKLNEHKSKL